MQNGGKEYIHNPITGKDVLGEPIIGMNFVKKDLNGTIISTKQKIETDDGFKLEYREYQGNITYTSHVKLHDDAFIVDRTDTDAQGKVFRSLYHDGNVTTYKDGNGNKITKEEFNNLL